MTKNIFIGIDLSFNSTGVVIYNQHKQKMRLYRIVYLDPNKKVNSIHNITNVFYSMPTNVISTSITDFGDTYSFNQYETTLKAMVCIKKIIEVVGSYLQQHKNDGYVVHINIEGFIGSTPNFNTITGLIMLQGMLRSNLIQCLMGLGFEMQMKITSPTKLKKFFSGNGNAEKLDMIFAFFKYYDGKKIINTSTTNMEINDVVDAFALMSLSVATSFGLVINTKKIKKKTPNKIETKIVKKKSGIVIKKRTINDII